MFFLPNISLKSSTKKYLQAEHIQEMLDYGAIMGSQSLGYEHLVKLNDFTLLENIQQSKTQFENRFGQAIQYFGYPYGETSQIIQLILKKLGFTHAFGQHSSMVHSETNAMFIPRFNVNNKYFSFLKKRLYYKPLIGQQLIPQSFHLTNNLSKKIQLAFQNTLLEKNPDVLNCYPNFSKNFFIEFIKKDNNNNIYNIIFNEKESFKIGRNRMNCVVIDDDDTYWYGYQWSYYPR